MDKICKETGLLVEQDSVVRLPFLVKGRLILPPTISRPEAEAAFAAADPEELYVQTANAQILRQPVIDRKTQRLAGSYLFLVLPALNPEDLIESEPEALTKGVYSISVDEILAALRQTATAWQTNPETMERALELTLRTNDLPETFIRGAFAAMQLGLNPESARSMIDQELSFWGIPGSGFLNGWVDVPAEIIPDLTASLAQGIPWVGLGNVNPPVGREMRKSVRAFPTRQLHITAGNAPEVPVVSALRAVMTKSACVVKSPAGSLFSSALLALAVAAALPDHPFARSVSIVYWRGGDEQVETVLFTPGAFDRVVVWGDAATVASVQSRALFNRVIALNPRYGACLIGREAFAEDLDAVVFAAAQDSLIYNQKSCSAALVHYVEGEPAQIKQYASHLREILANWDLLAPPYTPPGVRGQLKRLARGKYARAEWYLNEPDGSYTSGAVVMPGEFDLLDHPQNRLVAVRSVEDLLDALAYLSPAVSTVGVYPEARRMALRDAIAGRGVSYVARLGRCGEVFPGQPHDGMVILNQLVDWKIS